MPENQDVLNVSQDSERERALQYEIQPFKHMNQVLFTRENAKEIFREYNQKGELNRCPDEIEPEDNAVYMFEGPEKKKIKQRLRKVYPNNNR